MVCSICCIPFFAFIQPFCINSILKIMKFLINRLKIKLFLKKNKKNIKKKEGFFKSM